MSTTTTVTLPCPECGEGATRTAEFWQDTPQDVTGATETSEQGEYTFESTLVHCAGCEALARMQEGANRALLRAEVAQALYAIPPKEATERELRAYLAATHGTEGDK